jgi:hypothetical protein
VPNPQSSALSASRILIKALLLFNLFTGVGLILAFPASFLFEPTFFEFFSKKPPRIDPSWLMPILRTWLVLALPMVTAVHILFTRLLEMVETVRTGDPFVPENATRLKTIAQSALISQLLNLIFGLMAAAMNAAGSNIDWQFDATGWLAVGLLFVLAQVFEEGTRMRQDLKEMI